MAASTAWMSYAYGTGLALQAAYFVLVARRLGADEFGRFAAALALVGILAPFAGWGSGSVLVMRTARDAGSYGGQLGASLIWLAVSGTLLWGIGTEAASLLFHSSSLVRLVVILGAAELFCARLTDLAAQAFQAHDAMVATANISIATRAARAGAAAGFFLLSSSHTAATWAVWYLVASLAASAFAVALLTRLGRPAFKTPILISTLRAGFYFALGSASKTVYGDIDKVMLSRISSVATAGFYTAAYRILAFVFAPVQAFVFARNTRFFREGAVGPARVWRSATRPYPFLVGYAAILGLAVWLLAPLADLVLGSTFHDSVSVLRWLALLPVVWTTHYLFGDPLMGTGRQRERSLAQLGTAFLNIGLNLWLIPEYSWRGAVVATFASEGLLAVAVVALLWRSARVPRWERSIEGNRA